MPTDLRVFEMISGSITPQSIGITDTDIVFKLVNIYKKSMRIANISLYFMYSNSCLITAIALSLKASSIKLMLISIPHSIVWTIFTVHASGTLFYITIYYSIITYYLMLKMGKIDTQLKNIGQINYNSRIKLNIFIQTTVRKLNDIFNEISEYNNNYWDKILFVYWFSMQSVMALLFSAGYFATNIIFGISCLMNTFLIFSILLFVIYISSAIYLNAYKTYNRLHSLITSNKFISIHSKLIVSFIINIYQLS